MKNNWYDFDPIWWCKLPKVIFLGRTWCSTWQWSDPPPPVCMYYGHNTFIICSIMLVYFMIEVTATNPRCGLHRLFSTFYCMHILLLVRKYTSRGNIWPYNLPKYVELGFSSYYSNLCFWIICFTMCMCQLYKIYSHMHYWRCPSNINKIIQKLPSTYTFIRELCTSHVTLSMLWVHLTPLVA